MRRPVLSIVIGTYNRIHFINQCLEALIGKVKVQHEIVVVDAGSTDGTREYLQTLPGINLVCDPGRIGQAQSLNHIFETLESKYVCWLSDDNIILPGMLDQAVSILEHDRKIGMVSLKVKDVNGPYVAADYLGGIWPSGVLNCNQGMVPTTLMKKLGGFDEHFRDYGIDSDLTTRILLEGYKVVYTWQVAIHHLRDHEADSWIDRSGRKQKMERAKELYRQKYELLIRSELDGGYHKEKRANSLALQVIRRFYMLAGQRGIPLKKWIGLDERDWQNLFTARFVSKMDFLMNIHKPYYLVQHIPDKFLREMGQQSLAVKNEDVHECP